MPAAGERPLLELPPNCSCAYKAILCSRAYHQIIEESSQRAVTLAHQSHGAVADARDLHNVAHVAGFDVQEPTVFLFQLSPRYSNVIRWQCSVGEMHQQDQNSVWSSFPSVQATCISQGSYLSKPRVCPEAGRCANLVRCDGSSLAAEPAALPPPLPASSAEALRGEVRDDLLAVPLRHLAASSVTSRNSVDDELFELLCCCCWG